MNDSTNPAKARIIKLLPETEAMVDTWAAQMNARREEARQSLTQEGIAIESWFRFEIDGQSYLLAYMREDSSADRQTATPAELDIDKIHRAFKTSAWDRSFAGDCTLLLDVAAKPLKE